MRLHVHPPTDAVAAVLQDDAAPETLRKPGDGGADVPEASAVPDRRDPGVPASTGHIDDVQGLLGGVADDERRRGVPVEAAEAGGDVDVDDVPCPERFVRPRDPVAYD